jgi:NAD(P)-dependent dehydrogenase (short-subunit alcohol dehydrogenase family)
VRVSDAVVMVTGGLSGLGLAAARRLLRDGARVVLVGRHRPDAQAIVAALGERALFVPADITCERQVAAAVDRAAGLGPLRVAVCCAGVNGYGRVLGNRNPMSLEAFSGLVHVNLVGTFNVLRLAAQSMATLEPVAGERGVVVCTASIAAFDGQVGQVAYAAAKAGIVGLTLPAARDLAEHRIRVVTIAPGVFDTPMLRDLPEKVRDSVARQTPHPNRLGRPEEYASLVAHVVSNPMLNGETIRLDAALRIAAR